MDGEKHIPFFELKDACSRKGCPLCSIIDKRGKRWMDNLLFEHVSDRPFRAAFRAAGGFCAEHARALGSSRDGLALAILYRDAMVESLLLLEKRKMPSGECPACIERKRIEDEYLGLLRVADGELRLAFENSDGLCLSHYSIIARSKKKMPVWIKKLHTELFTSLKQRADRFIELSAYGYQDEFLKMSKEDQLVWIELLEKIRKR